MLKTRDAPNGALEASYESLHLKPNTKICFPKNWMLKQVNTTSVSNTPRFYLYAAQQRVDQKEVFLPADVRFDNKNLRLGGLHTVPRNCSNIFKHNGKGSKTFEEKVKLCQTAPTSFKVESSGLI